MNKKQQTIGASLFVVFCFLFINTAAAAPRIYFERYSGFGVRVLIDSPVPVNAYDVAVAYDPRLVAIEHLDTSKSVVTIMPSPIKATDGLLLIKGGSVMPFTGVAGELARFDLRPLQIGGLDLAIIAAKIYQADGQGTELAAAPTLLPVAITAGSLRAYQVQQAVAVAPSAAAPVITTAAITENPYSYGERLLVFQAQAPESAIVRYEVRNRFWFSWSPWREAVNPYPVDDGAWAIQLKAVDDRGNAALATVYELGNAIWKALALVATAAAIMLGIESMRRRRKVRYTK